MKILYIIAGANGSGKTTFAKSFASLNDLHFYLFLETPKTNILRVKNRVLNGGHNVPTEDIIRRFYRSKDMFWTVYKEIVDKWIVYYNSNEIFEEIADQDAIYDDEKYQEFLKDIR